MENKILLAYLGEYLAIERPEMTLFDIFFDNGCNTINVYGEQHLAGILYSICDVNYIPCKVFFSEPFQLKSTRNWSGKPAASTLDEVTQTDEAVVYLADVDDGTLLLLKSKFKKVFTFKEMLEQALVKKAIVKPIEEQCKKKNISIGVLSVNTIAAKLIQSPSTYERMLLDSSSKAEIAEIRRKSYGIYRTYSEKDIAIVAKTLKWSRHNGHIVPSFYGGKWRVAFDGFFRHTKYQPEVFNKSIYIIGNSRAYGYFVKDQDTVASLLQSVVNKNMTTENSEGEVAYRVLNVPTGSSHTVKYMSDMLTSLPFEDGDIIVLFTSFDVQMQKFYARLDSMSLFQRPHDYGEIFVDRSHLGRKGNAILAKSIFEHITANKITTVTKADAEAKEAATFDELNEFLTDIGKLRKNIGSIVMNCNPFTLGHRYLIETSAKKCLHLYIFVVEEDKSVFPFAERFELVKKGTADLPNVTVLPSGKFIISSVTFSDYFNKSELQDSEIDPSQDVELFAEHIAPALGVNVRFAGEEPLDRVTLQYNQAMARILPSHGIRFEVIPRKESGGAVISASRVRALLKDNDFDEIKKIVPETTLAYLTEKYGSAAD